MTRVAVIGGERYIDNRQVLMGEEDKFASRCWWLKRVWIPGRCRSVGAITANHRDVES